MQAPNYGYFARRAFLESTGKYAVWGLYHADLSCSRDCPLIILRGTSSLSRARASCLGKYRLESGRSFSSNRRVLCMHFVVSAITKLRLLRAANVPLGTTLTSGVWTLIQVEPELVCAKFVAQEKAALVSVRAAWEEERLVSFLAEYTCRRLAKVKCSSVSCFCINFVTHAITKLRLFREQRVFCTNGHIFCLSMWTLQKIMQSRLSTKKSMSGR